MSFENPIIDYKNKKDDGHVEDLSKRKFLKGLAWTAAAAIGGGAAIKGAEKIAETFSEKKEFDIEAYIDETLGFVGGELEKIENSRNANKADQASVDYWKSELESLKKEDIKKDPVAFLKRLENLKDEVSAARK